MANILLLTLGSDGDVRPFVRLGRTLKVRGHAVTLLTHADYADMAQQNGLDFIAMDTPEEYRQFIAEAASFNNPQGVSAGYQKYFLPRLLPTYRLIEAQARAGERVIVAHHNARLAAQLSAEKLGLPLVITFVWPGQITNLPLLGELLRTLPSPELDRICAEMSRPLPPDWGTWLRAPALNLGLWPEWFAPVEPGWPPRVILAGFLVDNASAGEVPDELESLLAEGQPPILITGGTGNFVSPDFYLAAAEGVRRLGRRGILVARYPEYVPADLPGNITRFQRLPYGKVLPRLGAIIHHGGVGTCAQSLAAGIPQVILAVGADRPDNAQRLRNLGVAEFLPPPRWQPDAVHQALKRLLGSAEVRERCQARREQIRLSDSMSAACAIIEKFVWEGAAQPYPVSSDSLPIAKPPVEVNSELQQQLAGLSPEKLELLARWAEAKPEATVSPPDRKR